MGHRPTLRMQSGNADRLDYGINIIDLRRPARLTLLRRSTPANRQLCNHLFIFLLAAAPLQLRALDVQDMNAVSLCHRSRGNRACTPKIDRRRPASRRARFYEQPHDDVVVRGSHPDPCREQGVRQSYAPGLPRLPAALSDLGPPRATAAAGVPAAVPALPVRRGRRAGDALAAILSTFGVSDLVRAGDRPAPVPSEIVEAIRAREQDGAFNGLDPRRTLQPGELVRVTAGAFADAVGQLVQLYDNDRVVGCSTCWARCARPACGEHGRGGFSPRRQRPVRLTPQAVSRDVRCAALPGLSAQARLPRSPSSRRGCGR